MNRIGCGGGGKISFQVFKFLMMVMAMSQRSIAIFGNKQRLLSIAMKTKVVQHVQFSSFQVFYFQVFQNIPGSQLLSDIQTFFAGNQLND